MTSRKSFGNCCKKRNNSTSHTRHTFTTMENTPTIQEFVAWVKEEKSHIERTTTAMAIEHAAVQLGVTPQDVQAWLVGKEEPSKTASILMRVLMRRNHFIDEPALSSDTKMRGATKKYPCIIFWSEVDQFYLGSIPGLYPCGPCCHGDTMEEVGIHLEEVLEMGIETYFENNSPLPESPVLIDENYRIIISPTDNGGRS